MATSTVIKFMYGSESSPVLYMHYDGDDAPDIIAKTKERMKDRLDDMPYCFARLCQIAMDSDDTSTGFGVLIDDGRPEDFGKHYSYGGFIIHVDDDWRVEHVNYNFY